MHALGLVMLDAEDDEFGLIAEIVMNHAVAEFGVRRDIAQARSRIAELAEGPQGGFCELDPTLVVAARAPPAAGRLLLCLSACHTSMLAGGRTRINGLDNWS